MSDENPYASPTAVDDGGNPTIGPEAADAIRRTYLRHESAIRSLGRLCWFCFALAILLSAWLIGIVALVIEKQGMSALNAARVVACIVCVVGAYALHFAATSLRTLRPGFGPTIAKTFAALALALAVWFQSLLLGLLGGFTIWKLLSPQGRYVFSAEYQRVIKLTPDLRPSGSAEVRLLVAAIALIAAASLNQRWGGGWLVGF